MMYPPLAEVSLSIPLNEAIFKSLKGLGQLSLALRPSGPPIHCSGEVSNSIEVFHSSLHMSISRDVLSNILLYSTGRVIHPT